MVGRWCVTDRQQTEWYVNQLTGDINTVIDWRMIHDKRKDIPAHTLRGTLAAVWHELQDYQAQGYGIFCAINQLDGQGQHLSNVIRVLTVD